MTDLPAHLMAACFGKVGYATPSSAHRVAAAMNGGRRRSKGVNVYRCDCGSWHIGGNGWRAPK